MAFHKQLLIVQYLGTPNTNSHFERIASTL
jgi:hypothetical protein